MKKVEKLFAAVLALAMILALAGCSGPEGGNAEESKAINWPTKTIEIIVPFGAGGDSDTFCREAAKVLSDELGVNTVVSNMTGGFSGAIGSVYEDGGDGYKIWFYNNSANAAFAMGMVDFEIQEMPAIGNIALDQSYALVIRAGEEYKSFDDMIEKLKAEPQSLKFATNEGAVMGILMHQVEDTLGVQFQGVNVGEDNATRLIGVLNGEADVMIGNYANFAEYIADGQLICIGIFADERGAFAPDVPTLKELGCDIVNSKTYGFRVSPNVDQEIIDILVDAVKKVTEDPGFIETVEAWNAAATYMTPEEQDKFDIADIAAYN